MANNRIYLRCNSCGEKLFLGKRLGGGYWYRNYRLEEGTLEEQLNKFYGKHEFCGEAGPDCFDIEYEDEDTHYHLGEDDEEE